MKGSPFTLVLWAALAVLAGGAARADDLGRKGLEIARSADRANQGWKGERATMTMELVNASGDVTHRKLRVETLEGEPGASGPGDKAKITLEAPPDVRGTKLLTWTQRQRDDDQWLYLPAIKRTRRISGSNKRGSFIGSELSYEDLASDDIEKFTYKYLDEPLLEGRTTFRLARTPKDPESAYGREELWLDKEYQLPLKIEFFDRSGGLLKRAVFAGHRKSAGFWRPSAVTMENLQTRKRTVIRWEDRQIGLNLPPSLFDSASLED